MFSLSAKAANAVTRNRIRRRLRHLLADRDIAELLCVGTYVLSADAAHASSSSTELRRALQRALAHVRQPN